jgi:hypothetical protein
VYCPEILVGSSGSNQAFILNENNKWSPIQVMEENNPLKITISDSRSNEITENCIVDMKGVKLEVGGCGKKVTFILF